MAGVSLQCGDCGALLKSVQEAQDHAELTSHSNFSESTEPVLNLVCTTCNKPCRSKTESDLHTKRTGHTEFSDKTLEAAKPISLEVPKAGGDESMMDVDANSSGSKSEGIIAVEWSRVSIDNSIYKYGNKLTMLITYLFIYSMGLLSYMVMRSMRFKFG